MPMDARYRATSILKEVTQALLESAIHIKDTVRYLQYTQMVQNVS